MAIEAAREGIPRSFRYADPVFIRHLLAQHHDIDKEWILVGTGSGELLSLAPLVFARDGNVICPRESYRSVANDAVKFGSQVKWVNLIAEKNYAYDIEGLVAAVDANTRLMFVVTPNNPTGTTLGASELRALADALPQHVLLLIDEAYIHFQSNSASAIDLLKEGYSNILVTRTFSKAYAMAGLRVGYGIGHPDIMKSIARFGCGPTSLNMAAFGAAAGALEDQAHVERSRAFVQKTRAYYEQEFEKLGLPVVSGGGIFIMVDLGERANAVCDGLEKRKVFVRTGDEWDMPRHLRVSYGLDSENQTFFKVLREIL